MEKRVDFEIIARIRRSMEARKLSIRALAHRTGVSYHSLQSYLLARHKLPAHVAVEIANVLGTDVGWLLTGRPGGPFPPGVPVPMDKKALDGAALLGGAPGLLTAAFWLAVGATDGFAQRRLEQGREPLRASVAVLVSFYYYAALLGSAGRAADLIEELRKRPGGDTRILELLLQSIAMLPDEAVERHIKSFKPPDPLQHPVDGS